MHHARFRAFPPRLRALLALSACTLVLPVATGCASRPEVRADDGIGTVIAQTDEGSRRPLSKPKPAKHRKKPSSSRASAPEGASLPSPTTGAGADTDPDLGVVASATAPRAPRVRLPLPRYLGDEFFSPMVSRAEGDRLREQIVFEALAQIGRPYIYGGADSDGFDCSGLVKTVFARSGVRLPRTAQQQCAAGTPVDSLDDARPGDLLCFDTLNVGHVSHIVLYTGQNMGVHAPRTNRTIVAVPMNTGYWMDRLVGISRVLR